MRDLRFASTGRVRLFRFPLRDAWGKQKPQPRYAGRGFISMQAVIDADAGFHLTHRQMPIPKRQGASVLRRYSQASAVGRGSNRFKGGFYSISNMLCSSFSLESLSLGIIGWPVYRISGIYVKPV